MGVYSFLDNQATIVGPGINSSIGAGALFGALSGAGAQTLAAGAGAAKEGLSVALEENKTTVTTGADGGIMTNLHAGQTGRITVRLLKTSPVNAVLGAAYAAQKSSAATWGQNQITLTNNVLGDLVQGYQMSFEKYPDNEYSEDGNVLAWTFIGIVVEKLGPGTPATTTPVTVAPV